MIDYTREAAIKVNGADVRGFSGWHFGPFNIGKTEMLMPNETIAKSWNVVIYLPFDMAVTFAFQRYYK